MRWKETLYLENVSEWFFINLRREVLEKITSAPCRFIRVQSSLDFSRKSEYNKEHLAIRRISDEMVL